MHPITCVTAVYNCLIYFISDRAHTASWIISSVHESKAGNGQSKWY